MKSASDILTPVTGEVVEVNSALESKPSGINEDPEGEGWIAKVSVSEEPKGLMNAEEYSKHTEDA